MAVQSVKAKINGQTVSLTYNEGTGFWEATTTAPSQSSYNQPNHYYGVEVTATDDSGNSTTVNATTGDFQDDLQLVVKEKVPPVITITSPTDEALLLEMVVIRYTLTRKTMMEMRQFRNPFSLR